MLACRAGANAHAPDLRRVTEDRRAKTKTYHWYQALPHVTYLLSQIVGDFSILD